MPRPSPAILGMIVLSILLAIGAVVIFWVRADSKGTTGEPLPDPISYAKPAPNGGRFQFVQFGSPEVEAKLNKEAKARADVVRSKFPKPGLYDNAEPPKLLWSVDGYAPDENVFLTSDGECVIRLEGEWWRTKSYPAGKKLDEKFVQEQLAAPAVSIFIQGELKRQYKLSQLVTEPDKLPNSPEHLLWPGGAVLNETESKFVLFTQDSNRIIFDCKTGDIISQDKAGLGNRRSQVLVTIVVVSMVLLALAWLLWALRHRQFPSRSR